MQTQVKAWGNSQGIRLPKDILQEANVEINDMLEVKVSDGMIMLVKTFRHQKLEERAEETKEMLAKAQQMEQDIINKANASSSDDLRYIG